MSLTEKAYHIDWRGFRKKIVAPLLQSTIAPWPMIMPDWTFLINDCGKLQILQKMLRERKWRGDKCIIFTQFTKMLDILESFVKLFGYRYLRLDGSLVGEARQDLVDRFNDDKWVYLLL